MRIIAGKHRGRILTQFQGQEIRPTPDRVKESLFQILELRLRGARVLDLFCGSGALGLECISRGAKEVVFNDRSRESLAVLKKNLSVLGESGKIYNLDYKACLDSVSGKFDLIFADPPYKDTLCAEILSYVKARKLLGKQGLVVYESEREETAPEGFTLADKRSYGRTKILFFKETEQ